MRRAAVIAQVEGARGHECCEVANGQWWKDLGRGLICKERCDFTVGGACADEDCAIGFAGDLIGYCGKVFWWPAFGGPTAARVNKQSVAIGYVKYCGIVVVFGKVNGWPIVVDWDCEISQGL